MSRRTYSQGIWRSRLGQPYHVGFTYSPGKNFAEKDYEDIENRNALAAAAVHLSWLQVGDQAGHNQYLFQLEQHLPGGTTRKLKHFLLIDQAHVCGSADWSGASLDKPEAPYDVPAHLKKQVKFADVEPIITRAKEIQCADILACLKSYPDEWCIGEELVDKLGRFLLERRSHLEGLLKASLPA